MQRRKGKTKPGVQAQVDWAEMGTVDVDGKVKKLFFAIRFILKLAGHTLFILISLRMNLF